MKKRVLKVFRPEPEAVLPVLEWSAIMQHANGLWWGAEWLKTPGKPGVQVNYSVEEYLGQARTEPSYLHKYNKNEFIHECYYGEVYLDGEVSIPNLPGSEDLQLARKIYGTGGFRIFYPHVASTGQPLQLYLGSPGIGVPSVWEYPNRSYWVCMVFKPGADGGIDYYSRTVKKRSTAEYQYNYMLSVGDQLPMQHSGFSVLKDVKLLTSNIPEFSIPPLYGLEYFETYSRLGLNGALSDAASSADGFHFSRLAGEIAMDGLVINTISSLSQRARSSIRKAGPLGSKLSACFKLLPSTYLAYQYGISAPLREYASLPGALENQFTDLGPLVGTHSTTFDDFIVSSRVSLNIGSPSSSRQAANLAFLTKGGLSLDDLWDLVPLSFVVDWFLNISKLLEAGRASQIYSELPIKSATFSTSFERDVPLPANARGSIHHRCYIRKYLQGSSLPAEVFSFSLQDFRGTLSLRNVDEGLALFLSYLV
jgi:hypothetical protein